MEWVAVVTNMYICQGDDEGDGREIPGLGYDCSRRLVATIRGQLLPAKSAHNG